MKRKLDLNALLTFRRVVDTGGFSAAAHASQRAVSSVSRQIAGLEADLGQALFYRHTRAVSLTEAGQRYIEAIRPLLDGLEDASETLTGDRDAPHGRLTINAPVAFGERQVVALIDTFRRRYPAVTAELRLTDTVVDPVRSGADITFRVGELADSSLIARPVAPMRYVLAAAPAYLAARGTPATPAELIGHDCLRYQGEYGRQQWYWRAAAEHAFDALAVDGPLYSDDAASLRHAAVLGQGFVLFPTWLIDAELAAGRLQSVLGEYEWEVADRARHIHLIHAAGRNPPAKIAAFIQHVLDEVGDPPRWDAALA